MIFLRQYFSNHHFISIQHTVRAGHIVTGIESSSKAVSKQHPHYRVLPYLSLNVSSHSKTNLHLTFQMPNKSYHNNLKMWRDFNNGAGGWNSFLAREIMLFQNSHPATKKSEKEEQESEREKTKMRCTFFHTYVAGHCFPLSGAASVWRFPLGFWASHPTKKDLLVSQTMLAC